MARSRYSIRVKARGDIRASAVPVSKLAHRLLLRKTDQGRLLVLPAYAIVNGPALGKPLTHTACEAGILVLAGDEVRTDICFLRK